MTASLIPPAKLTFVDINGNPLVGGFVYFYTINTLVPKDTWLNSEQTALNTNPVVLDSRGQAVIYGTGSYRQVLTDADGNLIWDQNIENFQESVFGPQQTLASHTVTDLGSASSNNILITGTTTINSFGTSASLTNPIYFIQFSGILTLTYNATSMILPGAGNITTAAGDSALVEVTNAASGYWRMIAYFSAASGGATGTAASYNIGTSGATVPLLNGHNIWSGINRYQAGTSGDEKPLTVTAGAVTPNFAIGNNFSVSISANLTINTPINLPANGGQSGVIRVVQTGSGLTVGWGGGYRSPGGIGTVNLSGINGAADYFAYYSNSSGEVIIIPTLNPS